VRLPRPTHKTLLVTVSGVAAAGAVMVGLVLLHLLVIAMTDAALDDALDARAAPLVRDAGAGHASRVVSDSYAQVVNAHGTVVAHSPSAPASPLLSRSDLTQALDRPVVRDATLSGLGDRARLRAVPVPGRREAVVVATSRDAADIFTTRHLHVAFVLFPLLVLSLLGGASKLVHATLRPVRWLADEALGAARGRRARIRLPPGEDEAAELAQALDSMMLRVRQVEDREKTFVEQASQGLRVPVGVLRGELRHAITLEDRDEIRRSLRLASAEAERMATMTTDLVVLAHERSGTLDLDLADTDVHQAVERATRALRTALGVDVTVQGEAVHLRCDRLRVEQAVTYLLANSAAAGAAHVQVAVRRHGEGVVVEVADDGPGFPADLLPHALEPFTKAQGTRAPRTAGAGLGLAVVAALARVHGGEVTVDNAGTLGGARVVLLLGSTSGHDRGPRAITASRPLTLAGAAEPDHAGTAQAAGEPGRAEAVDQEEPVEPVGQ